ncbi:hypothetical protein [Yersinia phage MHG19]|nr:hypothetical protein [Yersinia phage MHG19]
MLKYNYPVEENTVAVIPFPYNAEECSCTELNVFRDVESDEGIYDLVHIVQRDADRSNADIISLTKSELIDLQQFLTHIIPTLK